jgi:hypothetical protein
MSEKENPEFSRTHLKPICLEKDIAHRSSAYFEDMERYPSGQREQTVNLSADAFEGSNPSLSIVKSVRGSGFMVHSQEEMGRGEGPSTVNYELSTEYAGVTQLVESPAFGGMVAGSEEI